VEFPGVVFLTDELTQFHNSFDVGSGHLTALLWDLDGENVIKAPLARLFSAGHFHQPRNCVLNG
jgi:hypothetical protein